MIFSPVAQFSDTSSLYFFIIYKNKGLRQYIPVYKSEVRKYGPNNCVEWN